MERQEPLRRHGRRRARRRVQGRAGPPAPEGPDPGRERRPGQGRVQDPVPQAGKGQAQGAGRLQPPALGPHRRRAAPDPEPGHPRGTAEEHLLQERHQDRQGRRRSGLDPEPGQAEAPQGLRRPLLQPHRLGRAVGVPRHHAPAPLGVHREERPPAGQGQAGHDLPGGHRHLRLRRGHLPALEGHPHLRQDLPRSRRRAALPDGHGRRVERFRPEVHLLRLRRHRRPVLPLPLLPQHDAPAAGRPTA